MLCPIPAARGPISLSCSIPGGARTFPALKGGSYGGPPVPYTALLPPPSLLGQLLRDLPPTLPSPKDAPGPCGAPPAPPSATTTQNSSAPTSALVFNGPFFPGAEGGSPSPALHPYYFFFHAFISRGCIGGTAPLPAARGLAAPPKCGVGAAWAWI